jgi:serine/threonine-protein kinase
MPQKQPDPSQPNFINHRFGNYHLIEFLGQGGFAQVYQGVHVGNQSLAAIKAFAITQQNQPNISGNEALESLKKEVGPLQPLNHPRIIRLLEIGIQSNIPGFPQGIPYLVMEYVPNGTLHEHCKKTGLPLAPRVVLDYVNQIAEGLQYLHDLTPPILHRDLKPLNLLLNAQNEIVIADFGLATALERSKSVHVTKVVKGTLGYMAPEQHLNAETRRESDQYSLAVITHELLTGVKPIQGNPSHPLPSDVVEVLRRGLAQDYRMRYPSVTEFAKALTGAITGISPTPTYDAPTVRDPRRPAKPPTATPATSPRTDWGKAGWGTTPSNSNTPGTPSSIPLPVQPISNQPVLASYDPASPGDHIKHFPVSGQVKDIHWIGRFLTATTTDHLHFWDMATPGNDATYPVKDSSWKFSPNRRFIAGSVPDGVEIYDLAQQTPVYTYTSLKNVTALAWSPDGQRIVAAGMVKNERALHLWNSTNGQPLCATQAHSGPLSDVTLLVWSPRGGYIASADQNSSVILWNAGDLSFRRGRQSGAQAFRLENLSDLSWSPDEQYLALLTGENRVHIWKANPFSPPNISTHTPTPWEAYDQSDFQTYFISGEERPIALWKPPLPWNSQAPKHAHRNLLALLVGPSTVEVINADNGATVSSHPCSHPVLTVAWAPDSRSLAAGCEEGIIEVWEPRAGVSPSQPPQKTSGLPQSYEFAVGERVFQVESLAWSADSRFLASVGSDPARGERMIWVWKTHKTSDLDNDDDNDQNDFLKKLGVNFWLALALGAFDLFFPALTGIVTNSLFAFFLIPFISLLALIWAGITLNEWHHARKKEDRATSKGVSTLCAISWGLTSLIIGFNLAQEVPGALLGLLLALVGGIVGWCFHRFLLRELHQSLFPSRFGSGFPQF